MMPLKCWKMQQKLRVLFNASESLPAGSLPEKTSFSLYLYLYLISFSPPSPLLSSITISLYPLQTPVLRYTVYMK